MVLTSFLAFFLKADLAKLCDCKDRGDGMSQGIQQPRKTIDKCIHRVPEMLKQQIICYMEQDNCKSLVFYFVEHL